MKKVVTMLLVGALAVAGAYEWRYSADMQEHISTVNRRRPVCSLKLVASPPSEQPFR